MTAPLRLVTRRAGGVSAPPFDSLNCGLHVGDDPAAVIENRRRALAAVGATLADLVAAEQVHGGRAAVVGRAEAGRGALDPSDALPGCDALITDEPGLALGLFFADCLPVFLWDRDGAAVGLAHAGWRGLVAGVIENAVAAFALPPGRLAAELGPAIGPCCFEVGDEVAAQIESAAPSSVRPGPGRPHADLPGAARTVLARLGVEVIGDQPPCTACHPDDWFSHRRDRGRTGRMMALIRRGTPPPAPSPTREGGAGEVLCTSPSRFGRGQGVGP